MKIAAYILAILGALNLRALPRVVHLDDPRWLLMLSASVCGILLLLVAIGILARKGYAWYLGFAAIAQGCIHFVLQVSFSHPKPDDMTIILIVCSGGAIAVGAYWSFIWYRQRKWFSHENVA